MSFKDEVTRVYLDKYTLYKWIIVRRWSFLTSNVDDLLSDAYLHIYEQIDKLERYFKPELSQLQTYIYRIIMNFIGMHIKKTYCRYEPVCDFLDNLLEDLEYNIFDEPYRYDKYDKIIKYLYDDKIYYDKYVNNIKYSELVIKYNFKNINGVKHYLRKFKINILKKYDYSLYEKYMNKEFTFSTEKYNTDSTQDVKKRDERYIEKHNR